MKFWEAMKALEEGKKVRCKDFEILNLYIYKYDDNGITYSEGPGTCDLFWSFFKDWEIYEKPPITHSFSSIVRLAKEGKIKKFRRQSWDDQRYSYFWCDDYKTVMVACELPGAACFRLQDFDALDWIAVN